MIDGLLLLMELGLLLLLLHTLWRAREKEEEGDLGFFAYKPEPDPGRQPPPKTPRNPAWRSSAPPPPRVGAPRRPAPTRYERGPHA